jgi:hypothetical protein
MVTEEKESEESIRHIKVGLLPFLFLNDCAAERVWEASPKV